MSILSYSILKLYILAGIYVHIPYCKQACHYCDFHFSTNTRTKNDLINAIKKEINLRKNFLTEPIETLYFGGGTPSLLSQKEITSIVKELSSHFDLSALKEFTLEANPDDLTQQKLTELSNLGVNRLSIGIQSFNNKYLNYFNRAHNAQMAFDCIRNAKTAGFENISIDLIFGIPDQSLDELISDLNFAIDSATTHISIYGLTIEHNTVFGKRYKRGQLNPLDEEKTADQLQTIMRQLTDNGFEQYEISNFCKPYFESKHNSSYWQGTHYLGLGPGAHSYNGEIRQFSVRNNAKYIQSIAGEILPLETEQLSLENKIDEYILTRLRTKKGIVLDEFRKNFELDFLSPRIKKIEEFVYRGKIAQFDDRICLTDEGKLIADYITEQLLI